MKVPKFLFAILKLVLRLQILYHVLSHLVTPYHTLSPGLERKLFPFGNFEISSKAPDFLSHLTTPCHSYSHLITPYPLGRKGNHFQLANLKLVPRIKLLSQRALGIESSFPDCITRMSFYQKYYQLLLQGKFPMKEKKFLVVGPPDSGRTSWFTPLQGMLTNIDLLFSSEKITAITCLEILFTKNLYHIETSPFICIAYQLPGFYILRVFSEGYFGTIDYSYSVTMSFIYSFFKI